MRVFCHVNDHAELTWQHFPLLFLLSKPLVIWAPSGQLVQRAHGLDQSLVSPCDLLDLVEDGHVEIHARRRWFDPASRRSKHWTQPSEWSEDFDGRICRSYAKLGSGFGGLIGHDDGTGDQWAVEQVNGKTTAYHDALEMVREGQVIPRTLERAKYSKVEGSEGLARFILRDAKNHIEAFNLAKSDSDVEPSEYWWTRPKLCGERKALVTPRNEPISFERYSQLAEIVNEISRPRSLKDLIDIKAKHGESFRHALWGLFGDEVTPAANEQVRLEEFARKQSWLEMAIGKGVADRVANTIGLVGLITSTLDVLTNQGSSLGVVELTAGFFPLAKNAAINRGFIPMRQWQEGDPISAALLQEPAVPWLPYWKGPRADKLREVALTLKGLNRM